MENRLIILGSGAAPGVPSLGTGFGRCNPENPKNVRTRASTYLEYKGVRLLIDTGPDMRAQLIAQNIRNVDGVCIRMRMPIICTALTICAKLTGLTARVWTFMPENTR